jgi:hypothetical protein
LPGICRREREGGKVGGREGGGGGGRMKGKEDLNCACVAAGRD